MDIYWKSDIFVAPIELGGGFRGKLFEALACGLSIVSTILAAFGIAPVNGEEIFVTDDYDRFFIPIPIPITFHSHNG